MRLSIATSALLAAASLAACGGGAASPPPFNTGSPAPTATPSASAAPVTYAAKLAWFGGATTVHGTSSYERLLTGARTIRDVGFTSPVLLVAPVGVGGNGSDGALVAIVTPASPAPSISPSAVTFAVADSSDVRLGAQASPPPGTVAEQSIVATVPGAAFATSATAAIPAPVSTTPSIPVIVYKRLSIGCTYGGITEQESPGLTIADNATQARNDDPTQDDLYITSGFCPPPFRDPSAQPTDLAIMHAPHGAIVLPMPAGGFSAIARTSWANATTTITHDDLFNGNAVLFKTADGAVCKFDLVAGGLGSGGTIGGQPAGQTDVTGPLACSTTAPDGF